MPDDPTDVLTSEHIASFNAALNQPNKLIATLIVKAQTILAFKKKVDELKKIRESLVARIDKAQKEGVGHTPRSDDSIKTLIKEIGEYVKKVEKAAALQEKTKYFFGKAEVKTAEALQKKIQDNLSSKCRPHASAALNDVLAGKGKDAGKAGPNVKHASAGKSTVKDASCTLFFTNEDEEDGLINVIRIIGVGSHTGPKSYMIHWSSTPKLTVDKEFSL